MAKKSRTPPPPRRVQAPKTRTAVRSAEERRRLAIIVAAAALGFVAIGAAAGIYALTGSDGGGGRAALTDAGCTLETFPAQEGEHVAELPEGFDYNSDPPTSGPHNPQPAAWDVYEEPVDQMLLVHNLEHGGVVIQYGDDVPDADVDALVEWYRGDPNGIIIAPRPELGDQIALAAWNGEAPTGADSQAEAGTGVLAKCPRFDEKAFDAFLEEYGFKGPERFPRESLQPGQF